MENKTNSILSVEPDESIVLKYFSLPEEERNEILISALEEETNNYISVIEEKYNRDFSSKEINNRLIAHFKHQQYDYLVYSLSRAGIMSYEDNNKLLCCQQRITKAKQHSSFYIAINRLSNTESLSEMQKVVVNDFKDEMRMEGYVLTPDKQNKLTEYRTGIAKLEMALDGKIRLDTDGYNKLKELIKKRRDLAVLLGYTNFAEMGLSSEGYHYTDTKKLGDLLIRLRDTRRNTDWSFLTETIPNISIGELENKALEYACELTGLEHVRVKGDFGNGIQIFEIKKVEQRFGWISFIETDKRPSGSTYRMRTFRDIGDGENIPDILISIMKPEDGNVSIGHIKTILHEIGHSLLYIFVHNCYPNCNDEVTPDAREFYSILFEGLLQDFLEKKINIRFGHRLPLRNSATTDNVYNSLRLICLHTVTTDEKIDKEIDNWQEKGKFIKDVAKSGYAVNKHSYIIGAALAEGWINNYRENNPDNYVECLMKWFVELCKKGTLAKAEDIFKILERES